MSTIVIISIVVASIRAMKMTVSPVSHAFPELIALLPRPMAARACHPVVAAEEDFAAIP